MSSADEKEHRVRTRNRVARHAERHLLRPRMAKGNRSAERRKARKARRLVHPGDDEVNLVHGGLGVFRGRFAYGRSCRGEAVSFPIPTGRQRRPLQQLRDLDRV